MSIYLGITIIIYLSIYLFIYLSIYLYNQGGKALPCGARCFYFVLQCGKEDPGATTSVVDRYNKFRGNGSFSVHSFNEHNRSILKYTDNWGNRFQEKQCISFDFITTFLKGLCLKGTVSVFWPRGPEIALTFLRNEFIVKLRNSEMGPSYGSNGKNFQLLFK